MTRHIYIKNGGEKSSQIDVWDDVLMSGKHENLWKTRHRFIHGGLTARLFSLKIHRLSCF